VTLLLAESSRFLPPI